MSSSPPDQDPNSLANARSDAAIRESLAKAGTQPSRAHDQAILEAARAFTDSGENEADRSDSGARKQNSGNSRGWPLAVAATAVLAIGIAFVTRSGPEQRPDVIRGEAYEMLPVADAVLTQPPSTFRWPEAGGGRSYRLVIRDSNGLLLHQGMWQAMNQFAVNKQLERQLSEAGDYLWVVEQRGQTDQALGPFRFRVSASPNSE